MRFSASGLYLSGLCIPRLMILSLPDLKAGLFSGPRPGMGRGGVIGLRDRQPCSYLSGFA